MAPATQYQITPWRTPSELLQTRSALYAPATPSERRHAISTIQAWKLRGNLPHAVESTAHLFDAIMFHESLAVSNAPPAPPFPLGGGGDGGEGEGEGGKEGGAEGSRAPTPLPPMYSVQEQSFVLRAAYVTAISRFATGLADLGRHRTHPGQSMFDVARGIGLPAHFVELRHESAHEEMPGLGRLVRAAQEALGWLWEVYWGRLEGAEGVAVGDVEDDEGLASLAENLRKLLKGFRSRRVGMLGKGKKGDAEKEVDEMVGECRRICERKKTNVEELVWVLVEEKLIVPGDRRPGASMEGAYMLWDEPLIALVREFRPFFESLVMYMISTLATSTDIEDEVDTQKEALFEWLKHILQSDSWERIRSHGDTDYQSTMLRECCLRPGYWPKKLGEFVLSVSKDDIEQTWGTVFRASLLQTGEAKAGSDVEEEPSTMAARASGDVVGEDEEISWGWRRDSEAWEPRPIGLAGP